MIFEFNMQPPELELADRTLLSIVVSELLRCHRHGHHLVIVHRDAATWLSETLGLSDVERATLRKLENDFTQSANLITASKSYITLTAAGSNIERVGPRLSIPMDMIDCSQTFNKSALVLEDCVSDKFLYEQLLKFTQKRLQLPPANFEYVHGGGSRTEEVFAQQLRDCRVACVLIDSDRSSPQDQRDKSRPLHMRLQQERWPLGFVFVHHGRELENTLPLRVIQKLPCAANNAKDLDALDAIEAAEHARGIEPANSFLLFFVFKKGLNANELAKMDEKSVNWLLQRANLGGIDLTADTISGFGSHLVEQLAENHAAISELFTSTRERKWQSVFGAFLTELFWIGIAPTPSIT